MKSKWLIVFGVAVIAVAGAAGTVVALNGDESPKDAALAPDFYVQPNPGIDGVVRYLNMTATAAPTDASPKFTKDDVESISTARPGDPRAPKATLQMLHGGSLEEPRLVWALTWQDTPVLYGGVYPHPGDFEKALQGMACHKVRLFDANDGSEVDGGGGFCGPTPERVAELKASGKFDEAVRMAVHSG